MPRFPAFMYDATNLSAPPVPCHLVAPDHADAVDQAEFATADPGSLWFGWTPVVDPFPFTPRAN